jgi:uncharacterized protein YaeQ
MRGPFRGGVARGRRLLSVPVETMAQPERREVKLSLSHVERDVQLERALVLSRHPSESLERVVLRVLAFCLMPDDSLGAAPGGVSEGDAPDLLARDATGQLVTWVRCGSADPEQVRKVINHNAQAAVHVVFSRPDRREAFVAEVEARGARPRGWDRVTLWTVDRALVQALAANEDTRQRWTVTFVGDQLYVDNGQGTFEGAATRG